MIESDVIAMLAARYCAPAYAFLPHVRNSTGFARTTRTADAIAMSLWPSRGMELHGFEVKVSRADWLRELKEPAKAEEIARRCDRWWIAAADREIVVPAELPPTWGLLVPRGEKLVAIVEAPQLKGREAIARPFLAALLRRVVEDWRPASFVEAEARKYAKEITPLDPVAVGLVEAQRALERAHSELEALRDVVSEFERLSGVRISKWDLPNVANDLHALMAAKGGVSDLLERFRHEAKQARYVAERLEDGVRALTMEEAPRA